MVKKIRYNKPVVNNATPTSKLQFEVAKDLDKAKKVKTNEVFDRKSFKPNPHSHKKCKC